MILPLLQLLILHDAASASSTIRTLHSQSSRSLLTSNAETGFQLQQEALSLLSFKASITADPLQALQSWRNSSSACSWKGITCGTDGLVSAINLTGLQLSGSFSPDSLSNLPHLTSLDLSNNVLAGLLPPTFCVKHTSQLTVLNLVNNSFSGPIPSALGNCTSLVQMSLYYNSLTGPIPRELASLHNLEYLALSFNQLNGSLPVQIFTNCTKLTTIALSLNAFSGLLPPQIGNLARLENLWLDSNAFSGSIPAELGNLTTLKLLQLDTNNLTGRIPPSLGRLTSLTDLLSLSLNHLSGSIPPQLGKLSNLNIMTLKGNFLSGTIPKELGNMKNIQGLFLGDNLLEGMIPVELANCTNMQQLRLNTNQLRGTIPDDFGSLQRLTVLHVHGNLLQGRIPDTFATLSSLQDLSLGYNTLEGPIPQMLANLSTIVFNFSMPRNRLNNSIPSGLGKMIHVQQIDLSSNMFTGQIPNDVGDCLSMTLLNLSDNTLTGVIPESIAELESLQILDLSRNSLSGEIPSSLSNLRQLQFINLSHNNLTGRIPSSGVFAQMNASSFLNNPGLCGGPLIKSCPVSTLSAPQASETSGGMPSIFKVLIAISSFLFFFLVLLFIAFLWRGKSAVTSSTGGLSNLSKEVSESTRHLRQFTIKELEGATDLFSDARLLGVGAVSKVYKATNVAVRLVPTIQRIDAAVKVLSVHHNPSFSTELAALGSVRHRNLVKLHGFCMYGTFHAFVLELLPKGSLQEKMYGPEVDFLGVHARLSIALDVAHGLAYLHHGLRRPIVHRDVKPSNILFDENDVARLSDFGIAKLLTQDEVFSKARGTIGYIAPEYGESTRIDVKGDVYSFGVVMLEMLTKKRPTDAMFGAMGVSLPTWVRDAFPNSVMDILDQQLLENGFTVEGAADEETAKGMVEVALLCTEAKARDRPSMEKVVQKLTSIAAASSSAGVPCKSRKELRDKEMALLEMYPDQYRRESPPH